MSEQKCSCSCSSDQKVKLLMTCSGAADVGLLADRVTRKLSADEWGQMSCLSGMGADISGFIQSAKAADTIILDGCPVKCGSKICQKHGIEHTSLVMTDFGVKKGETNVTDQLVNEIAVKVKAVDHVRQSC